MRNIRKKLNVKDVRVKVYDTADKLEKIVEGRISEVESELTIPEGCVIIPDTEEVLSEKEVTYKMTPQEFVKYATLED